MKSASEAPDITVLMATYNHEKFVVEAVESVMSQETEYDYKLSVKDDASTDGTQQLLLEMKNQWPDRLDLILEKRNTYSQGVALFAPRIVEIDSQYIAFCEGDDYWTDREKLQKQVDFMESNAWCNLSHHGIKLRLHGDTKSQVARALEEWERDRVERPERQGWREIVRENFVARVAAVVRRSSLRNESLSFIHNLAIDDWLMWMLALEDGDAAFMPEEMAAYRIHDANVWAQSDPDFEQIDRLLWMAGTILRDPAREGVRQAAVGRILEKKIGIDSMTALSYEIEHLRVSLEAMVKDRDFYLEREEILEGELEAMSAQADAAQKAVEAAQTHIDEIYSSRGWRMLESMRNLRPGK